MMLRFRNIFVSLKILNRAKLRLKCIGSIFAVLVALFIYCCRHEGLMKQIKRIIVYFLLISVSSLTSALSQTPLRAGVASMITPVSAVKYYQQVVDYIGTKLGVPAEMVHRTTYDEIDVLLENNAVDVAFICSSPYVLDNEKFGAELLVAPQVYGKVYYHSNIIVHKDSSLETFEQLKDLSFAFVDPKSNTGRLYPTYLLAKRDELPDSFFSSTSIVTATISQSKW